jgi:hypothetical protein
LSLGRRPISCIRPSGAYSDATGQWQETAAAPFTIEGSIQPLKARELEALPEGRRASARFKVYTDFRLQTVDDKAQKNPDRLTFRVPAHDTTAPLRTYEVISVSEFQSGIVSHYKAIVSLLEQTPDGVAEA